MTDKVTINGPFSLIILLGLFAQKLPLSILQPFLNKAMLVMQKKHSAIFQRLGTESYSFIIEPLDLPFIFYLQPSIHSPTLKAIKKNDIPVADAKIKGTFIQLLQLFEGKLDGDAAFFSKELIIEGSTAATVALRNAVDSEEINIVEDLSEIFKPFNSLFKKFANFCLKYSSSLESDMTTLGNSITYNNSKEIDKINSHIYDLQENVDDLYSIVNKITRESIRKKSDYIKSN